VYMSMCVLHVHVPTHDQSGVCGEEDGLSSKSPPGSSDSLLDKLKSPNPRRVDTTSSNC
jgi:hypothetical protein